ncbi:hypothetical protein Tco_0749998 [Tanacetum coccineum]|uniref:Uncharacterized protein n=1 Tax=Tanacetum coccineum TaxID=301880 RepID=A0ABQ4Z336_9ASTR
MKKQSGRLRRLLASHVFSSSHHTCEGRTSLRCLTMSLRLQMQRMRVLAQAADPSPRFVEVWMTNLEDYYIHELGQRREILFDILYVIESDGLESMATLRSAYR